MAQVDMIRFVIENHGRSKFSPHGNFNHNRSRSRSKSLKEVICYYCKTNYIKSKCKMLQEKFERKRKNNKTPTNEIHDTITSHKMEKILLCVMKVLSISHVKTLLGW
jgi:hypothetical protein